MSLESILFILVDYLDFESLYNLDKTIKFNKTIWTRFLFSKCAIYNEDNPKEICKTRNKVYKILLDIKQIILDAKQIIKDTRRLN